VNFHFQRMHYGTTFILHHPSGTVYPTSDKQRLVRLILLVDFCSFFSAITYQRLLPDVGAKLGGSEQLAAKRHEFFARSCSLSVHRTAISSRTDNYYDCRVQVWSTLSEDDYVVSTDSGTRRRQRVLTLPKRAYCDDSFHKPGSSIAKTTTNVSQTTMNTPPRRKSTQHNRGPSDATVARFKMAIFARGPNKARDSVIGRSSWPAGKTISLSSGSSSSESTGEPSGPVCVVFEREKRPFAFVVLQSC
jgi:hypothetical protein